ncbi:glycosyltransferase [Salinibacterium sp. SWN248]|uniref:glycosyltransferase n=1 Tax=Salinibacterium sp. SWN248 TaxID=2792056 RepID=UPI0018CFD57C|nr:hypothetical protein [Salinibacterium sp. SWN248]MBH0023563.1 hypothetical protein [Salinibacterium sp. SWN248]
MIALLPERVSARLRAKNYRYSVADVPAAPVAKDTAIRLYIAPVNFAGQGFQWARAAEKLPNVSAISMHYVKPGDFGYPVDNPVPVNVTRFSRSWQQRQFAAVSNNFSHVIVEANRAMFGTLFDSETEKEIRALRAGGVAVAALCHGTELRLPSRHQKIDQWSPFNDVEWPLIPEFERKAMLTRQVLSSTGIPVFVSTPELLLDWPEAQWLPIVIDIERWVRTDAPLQHPVLRVVHAPSKDTVKGTHLIDETMRRLHEEGVVDYRVVRGIPAAEMPAEIGKADIVIDQFRIGNYGTAAIEAMAAGRLVISHVHDQVRDHVRAVSSRELPTVEATPDSLEHTIRDIAARRERYLPVAAAGPEFVRELHDGRLSSRILASFLGQPTL